MSAPSVDFKPSPANDSAAAQQLQQGFPWLRFGYATLEREFRHANQLQSRWLVFVHLALAMLLLLSFLAVDESLLARADSALLNGIHATVVFALVFCIVLLVGGNRLAGYYPLAIQFMAPIVGLCVVTNELIAQPSGMSFMPIIVLTVFSLYLFVGMRFLSALTVGMSMLLAYLVGALVVGVPFAALLYNGSLLVFTNAVGATAAYTLEKLRRTAFLEARLLTEMANRDGLTNICNRRAFDEHLSKLWQQAVRDQRPIALMLIDIDHFKAFNDHYGHQAGDYCLQQVAEILASVTRRPLDMCARYGGEEFAVLLHDVPREHVEYVAGTIQTALQQLGINNPLARPAAHLTVSIGAACVLPQQPRSSYGMVQLADEALYEAKDAGRNRVIIKDSEYADLRTGAFRNSSERIERLVS